MHLDELPNIDAENTEVKPAIYKKNGKNVIVTFDKCFEQDSPDLNNFIITKSAYSKNLDSVCRYANTFFKLYDTDKEFLTGLLCIKYQIDNQNIHYSYKTFLSDIAELLLTDSVIEKIFEMVEDYYSIDLSPSDEVKDIDLHALQFLNEHGKALMALSIAYKLTIPVVCHYYYVNNERMAELARIRGENETTIKDYLYQVFASYFPLFQGDSELFNKLAVTVNSHLTETRTSDKTLWNRARNKKLTPTIYTDRLIAAVVVDLLPKAIFKKNFIFLIQVAVPYQIRQTLLAKDKYDYCDISTSSKTDELSGLEKLEANNARISDLDIVISSVNIKETIKKIERRFKVHIEPDEIAYYKEHLKSFTFSDTILQFFAKYFGGYYDLKTISKKYYIRLMIIFKKIMKNMGFIYINQIMTGNLSKTIKRRKISTKQLKKIEQSPKFQKLMKQYSMGMETENNPVLRNIAMLINTPIEYCDYENPEMYGMPIQVDIDIAVSEYLRFLSLM